MAPVRYSPLIEHDDVHVRITSNHSRGSRDLAASSSYTSRSAESIESYEAETLPEFQYLHKGRYWWWWGERYNPEVATLARKLKAERGMDVPAVCACGRAVLWAYVENVLVWLIWLLAPYVFRPLMICGEGTHLPQYPPWVWLLFPPLVWVLLRIEWKCLTYKIIPQVQAAGAFRFLGMELSYSRWRILVLGLSVMGRLSYFTTGLFKAKTMALDDCPVESKIPGLWAEAMENSLLSVFGFKQLGFQSTVAVAYWMMSFQLVVALALSVPLYAAQGGFEKHFGKFKKAVCAFMKTSEEGVPQTIDATGMPEPYRRHFMNWCDKSNIDYIFSEYSVILTASCPFSQKQIQEAEDPPRRWKYGFKCVSYDVGHGNFTDDGKARQFDYTPMLYWWPTTSHTSALLWLATSGDMPSIASNHLEYLQTRYDIHIRKLETEHRWECERMALDQVLICMADTIMKLIPGTMFDKAPQMYIQTTVVAMNLGLYKTNHLKEEGLNFTILMLWQDIFGVAVSVASVCKLLLDTMCVFCWCVSCMRSNEFRKIVHSAHNNEEVLKRHPDYGRDVEELGGRIKRRLGLCVASWALMLLFLEYDMMQLVMFFRCEHAIWSLTGCMDDLPSLVGLKNNQTNPT